MSDPSQSRGGGEQPPAAVPQHMLQAPRVGPLPPLTSPVPATFDLSCGLPVMAVARKAAPIVAMNLIIRSGSDRDPAGKSGLASLTAEMMDEGAGTRGALEIAEALEALGAELWLGAGRDGAQLTLLVPAAELAPALSVAADIVLRPRHEAADWERVLGDRLTGLAQRRDQPEAVADLVTAATLFGPAHPYGRSADGRESTVAGLTLDDVNQFHQTFWRPNNAVLAVAGDFELPRLREELERAFGAWQPRALPVEAPLPALPKAPRLVMVDRPGAPQSVLRLVGPGSSRHAPERPALSMLNVILGGSFTSRLNFTLREKKGYTYGAGSSFSFYRRPSAFVARSSVFTQVTAPAVTDFLTEIGGMSTGDLQDQELTKARASLLDRTAEALATAGGIAGTFAELGLYELPADEPTRFIEAVAKTDAAKLKSLAQRFLDPDKLSIVVVGDRATVEPGLREIGLPEPLMCGPEGDPA